MAFWPKMLKIPCNVSAAVHFCSTIVTSVGHAHCRQLQARVYFCKPHSEARIMPGVASCRSTRHSLLFPTPTHPAEADSAPTRRRAPGAHVTGLGRAVFILPSPFQKPASSLQAEASYCSTTRVTLTSANQDAAPQVRPAP